MEPTFVLLGGGRYAHRDLRLMHPNLVSIVICMCLCNVEVTMASPVAMRDELRPPARVDIMTR